MAKKQIPCECCNKLVSFKNYKRHLLTHERNNSINCICSFCNKQLINYNALRQHEIRCKLNPNHIIINNSGYVHQGHPAWNKGLTKDTDARVAKCGETLSKKIKAGEVIPSQLNKPHSEETRKKISEGMKLAHAEGRAHNIGDCRWNNEPSYPEQWFMTVIENEINDKNYIREYPFGKFSLDFAWPEKKIAIEIDGEQHFRTTELGLKQQERDKQKDLLLAEEGWLEIRTPWTEIFNNPKEWIAQVKSLIDS